MYSGSGRRRTDLIEKVPGTVLDKAAPGFRCPLDRPGCTGGRLQLCRHVFCFLDRGDACRQHGSGEWLKCSRTLAAPDLLKIGGDWAI